MPFWSHGIYNAFEHCLFICNADITNTLKFLNKFQDMQVENFMKLTFPFKINIKNTKMKQKVNPSVPLFNLENRFNIGDFK